MEWEHVTGFIWGGGGGGGFGAPPPQQLAFPTINMVFPLLDLDFQYYM